MSQFSAVAVDANAIAAAQIIVCFIEFLSLKISV
jgi:hypothetical protein